MSRNTGICLLICTAMAIAMSLSQAAATQDPEVHPNTSTKLTIRSYVRDVACLMKFSDALEPTNDCALMCARAGSPLVIVTTEGAIYLPISDSIPDTSMRDQLMPFVGTYVEVSGDVYERSGMKSIVIRQIQKTDKPKAQRVRPQPAPAASGESH